MSKFHVTLSSHMTCIICFCKHFTFLRMYACQMACDMQKICQKLTLHVRFPQGTSLHTLKHFMISKNIYQSEKLQTIWTFEAIPGYESRVYANEVLLRVHTGSLCRYSGVLIKNTDMTWNLRWMRTSPTPTCHNFFLTVKYRADCFNQSRSHQTKPVKFCQLTSNIGQ